MAKITISQLNAADAASIQELTNAELDATKGGLLNGLKAVVAPTVDANNTALLGQVNTICSTNTVGTNLLQKILNVGL